MLTACEQAEKEKEAKIGELSKKENFKWKENEMFAHTTLSLEAFFSGNPLEKESFLDKKEDNWEDDPDGLPAYKSSWLDIENTLYTKKKLIEILVGDVPIPKQQ